VPGNAGVSPAGCASTTPKTAGEMLALVKPLFTFKFHGNHFTLGNFPNYSMTVTPLCYKIRWLRVGLKINRKMENWHARQAPCTNLGWHAKGAFVFSSKDRKKWDAAGPFFGGQEVHHIAQDPRDPKRYYAAVGNAWFGPHLHASTDNGKTWEISEKGLEVKGITGKTWQVTEKGMELKETPDAPLKRIWHIAPGADDEPGAVYLGADPGVLFRSGDNGANWEMVPGLCNHPTREKWNPGAGGMMVHSIQCLATDASSLEFPLRGRFVRSTPAKHGNRLTAMSWSILGQRNFPPSANAFTN